MEFSYSLISSLMWRGIKYLSLQKEVKTLVSIRFELEKHITTMSDMKQRISMDEIVVICEDFCGSLFMEALCTCGGPVISISVGPVGKIMLNMN